MPLEKSITRTICRHLKARHIWHMKIAGHPMQRSGIPDLLLIIDGQAIFLEVKQPGEYPTPKQRYEIQKLRDAGAIAETVRCWEDVEGFLPPQRTPERP